MRNYTLSAKIVLVQLVCILSATQTLYSQNAVMYGMTQNGGADSVGAIIAYNLTTGTESVVYSFGRDSDGQIPSGSLVYCPLNGLLYGLTAGGGKYGNGAVISFNPANNTEAVAWNLGHASNGPASPYGDLVYDANNHLFYAMTFGGGDNAIGCVFSFNPAIDSIKQLWNFGYNGGANLPYGNLVLNPNNGLYYGMTSQGGNNNDGAIITLNPLTDTVHRVYNFNDGQSGETPNGSLVWSSTTNLFYGMTSAGGADSLGTLFSFNPADSVETTLHNFGFGTDAAGPLANLIYNENTGLFYGLSINGGEGNGQGTIFSFNPANDSVTVLHSFGNVTNDGEFPNGSLIYDAADNLYYGLTQGGGTNHTGTIFSFNPSNNAETTLWSLGSGTDGAGPQGSLLLLNNGFPAAINNLKHSYNINLYPNPGNGNFLLQSQNATGATYSVYNINGELISAGTIQSDLQNINLIHAADGMYIMKIDGKEGTVPVRFAVIK